ncbi:hypothetical protein DACRYDRAFT_92196 [Dacryopinax primogenitus]|uniref:Uncharacterized protein n=1 Tax=Dacryopinax primogenitus (strain DJM 731) TaxID=1858805 RepID=M5GAU5_DACPD|nr:uncharacterized protein DACRYDRAFT_92196 [Dacryopinax primogenitus]EJU06014.1 hypothetical protein DACRYDRAFT_92196 [Dacryopinax primogenitus]
MRMQRPFAAPLPPPAPVARQNVPHPEVISIPVPRDQPQMHNMGGLGQGFGRTPSPLTHVLQSPRCALNSPHRVQPVCPPRCSYPPGEHRGRRNSVRCADLPAV